MTTPADYIIDHNGGMHRTSPHEMCALCETGREAAIAQPLVDVALAEFICCFCGKIEKEQISWTVNVSDGDLYQQLWWAHPECFKEALHIDARHFPDDEEEDSDN